MEKEKQITKSQAPIAEEAGMEEAVKRPAPEPAKERATSDVAQETAADLPERDLSADLPSAYRKLLSEKEDLYDRLLRKQAELENSRKRLQREKEDFLQQASADLIRALLPVLDGFERAMKHRDASVPEEFYQGLELIYGNLLEVLKRAGLAPIEAVGELFDPHLHQAVETVEAPGYRDQEIVEQLQRGYKLRQRLLRPAIVKVAVTPREQTVPEEGTGQEVKRAK